MDKLKALTSKKVAGVPVVYIAAIVAVVILYMAIRSKPTPDPAAEDAAASDGADTEGDASYDVVSQQPVFLVPSTTTAAATPVEFTNDAWGKQAIEWLIAQGNDPSLSSSAITKYLASDNLTFQEGSLRDDAVKQFGLPPEGLSTSRTLGYKGPASAQGVPPTDHTVRGKSDDTFKELARLYYGSENADYVAQLRARNSTAREPLAVGTTVRIPEAHNPKYYRATASTRSLYAIARKNAVAPSKVENLNPGMKFPVKVGTRVRVR